ncbi:MAG TPA: hypothetical protein VGK86_08680 [Thermoanaerobaculia bacterium]|jgi:hypothetical protein
MRSRTILAVALLASLALVPQCTTRSRYATRSSPHATPLSVQESETVPPSAEMTASAAPDQAANPVETAAPAVSAAAESAIPAQPQPADLFRTTIRPILSARCGACHDPGGKMYARLPFDDPKVVASHSEGVLRRLKGDDREALQRWIAGLAPAGTQQ